MRSRLDVAPAGSVPVSSPEAHYGTCLGLSPGALCIMMPPHKIMEERGMNLRRVCLAALILMPWLAVAGEVAVAHELVTRHGLWCVLAGCAAVVVAFEVSTVAYRVLKARPVVSRAEAVRRLSRSGPRPPFEV